MEEVEEEMQEVEELAINNRLLDSPIEIISSVGGIWTREENEDLIASATMIMEGVVVNVVVMIVRMMVVTVGGKVGELIGEEVKPITGRQVGGRENHYSNHLILRLRKKGAIFFINFLASFRPKN